MPNSAGGTFAQILAARRGRFNSLFAEAKTYRPALDGAAFAAHLTRVVGPVVERVAEARPEQAEAVAEALYELSLDLVGREFFGPHSRYPALAEGWTTIFTQLPNRLAATTPQPAGASGQLARAGCPVGHAASTTVTSAGGGRR